MDDKDKTRGASPSETCVGVRAYPFINGHRAGEADVQVEIDRDARGRAYARVPLTVDMLVEFDPAALEAFHRMAPFGTNALGAMLAALPQCDAKRTGCTGAATNDLGLAVDGNSELAEGARLNKKRCRHCLLVPPGEGDLPTPDGREEAMHVDLIATRLPHGEVVRHIQGILEGTVRR